MKWEYIVERAHANDLLEQLRLMGLKGWELVGIATPQGNYTYELFFKRLITNT